MKHPDPDRISALITAVAQQEILPRFRALGEGQVRTKGNPNDLVTDADIEAEKALARLLPAELPGSVVVGEESVHADPAVLDRLKGEAPVWVVDPVDGTRNFATGKPLFATLVALVIGGRTVQGWLHDPVRGLTITAEEGAGTWLNGERLHVAGQGMPLADLVGSTGFSPAKALRGRVRQHLHHASAGHDYMALVEGRIHFALFRRLMPWDHAAGVLAHQEAGGFAALRTGEPYSPLLREGALILTPDKAIHDQIRALLAGT
ncbi:inositol monophosphatase family protein [Novispirillum sp. DQ9]|uniref:inositol monophosphatase family protein n=1 Tax=Novispirillum sp. DQ9 TaxID=3398612 RepID=UPI003C7D76F4